MAIDHRLVQGGIQSLSRSLFGRLVPVGKAGEFFGFYNLMGKAAAILGPTLTGIVALLTHDSRLAILSIVILFVIGAAFLVASPNACGSRWRRCCAVVAGDSRPTPASACRSRLASYEARLELPDGALESGNGGGIVAREWTEAQLSVLTQECPDRICEIGASLADGLRERQRPLVRRALDSDLEQLAAETGIGERQPVTPRWRCAARRIARRSTPSIAPVRRPAPNPDRWRRASRCRGVAGCRPGP